SVTDNQGGAVASTYDAQGNLLSRTLTAPQAAQMRANVGYDGNGNVQSETRYSDTAGTHKVGSSTFSYDDNRLKEIKHQDGSANGNRTSGGSTVAANNELSSDGTWNYQYDLEGNLIGKTSIATGETWSYSYDNVNHMTAAVHKNSSGNVLMQAAYSYDVFGNLI